MSGRPDHVAARWAADAESGVEEPVAGPVTIVGAPRFAAAEGGAGEGGAGEGAAGEASGGAVEASGGAGEASGGAGEGGAGEASGAAGEGAAGEGGLDGGPLPDVAAISAQRDEYLESLQRLKADFDNYRKRVARLQEEQSARAEANLVTKLLPVIDNLDLAWSHLGPRDGEGQGEGGAVSEEARAIAQARGQLLDVLVREGLERVDTVGVPFDPHVHDAVAHADPDDERPGTFEAQTGSQVRGEGDETAGGPSLHAISVDGVLRAGYLWRGQVLRPAMVRVRG
jgi:molecular chaperone GrpE